MKIILVAGACPNFKKVTPAWFEMRRLKSYGRTILLNMGPHYLTKEKICIEKEKNT